MVRVSRDAQTVGARRGRAHERAQTPQDSSGDWAKGETESSAVRCGGGGVVAANGYVSRGCDFAARLVEIARASTIVVVHADKSCFFFCCHCCCSATREKLIWRCVLAQVEVPKPRKTRRLRCAHGDRNLVKVAETVGDAGRRRTTQDNAGAQGPSSVRFEQCAVAMGVTGCLLVTGRKRAALLPFPSCRSRDANRIRYRRALLAPS